MQTLNLQTIRKAQAKLLADHKKALVAVRELQLSEEDFKSIEVILTKNFDLKLADVIKMHKTGEPDFATPSAVDTKVHFVKDDAAITGKLAPASVLNEKNEDVF